MFTRTTVRTGTAALVLAGAVGFGPGLVAANAAPAPSAVAAAQPTASTIPVTGTLGENTPFTGALSNLTASVVDGVLTLSGTVTGTGLPAGGTTFSAPVENLTATDGCSILNLDLGALDLDVLGLVVNLAPVSLDVTAVPGAGKLLGNLLCAVTQLLDGGPAGALNGVVALLNRLLTGLGL